MSSAQEVDPHVYADQWEVLPTISLAGWFEGDAEARAAVAAELYKGATRSGFFYIKDHGIPDVVIERCYAASRSFHDQPADWKEKYNINKSRHHRGYVPMKDNCYEKDGKTYYSYHETFDLSYDTDPDDPRVQKPYGMVGPNVWPDDLPGFREAVSEYYDAVYQLGRELLAAFELGLGLAPGRLMQHVNVPTSQLRLLRYLENDAPRDETNQGIGAHSDFECFTILHTGGPGLQLMSYDDHWVDAPPQPGTFVVNIGDCLEAWTGGLFKSTQHRVVNLGIERYSLPLFFSTDFDVEIKPLPELASDEALARYTPFVAGEHLWGRTISHSSYLRNLIESGDLVIDFEIPEENPFKRKSVAERALEAKRLQEAEAQAAASQADGDSPA